jgi:hypothetical protein
VGSIPIRSTNESPEINGTPSQGGVLFLHADRRWRRLALQVGVSTAMPNTTAPSMLGIAALTPTYAADGVAHFADHAVQRNNPPSTPSNA